MEQLELDLLIDEVRPKHHQNTQAIPKNRDKNRKVNPKSILFSRKPYDTEFYYYTEIETDFAVKNRK